MHKFIIYLIICSGLFYSITCSANLRTANVSSLSGNNISRTNPSSVTLRWSMTSEGAATLLPGPVISSTTGRFTNGAGLVIRSNNRPLSKRIIPSIPSTTVTITESVRIPKDVLFTAHQLGLTQLTYERQFTDCPGERCNTIPSFTSITFNLSGSAGSSFGISNYRLRFDDGKINYIVQQGEPVGVTAFINVTRSGTVRAVWELARPSSTSGKPVFHPLKTIQRQLTSFATNPVKSPTLPSTATGIYLIRLRFIEPGLPGQIPTLQYLVNENPNTKIKPLQLTTPKNLEALRRDTLFSWQPITNAAFYKLELQLDNEQQPSGILVKSDSLTTQLNKLILHDLKINENYQWRVMAFDKSGKLIARSAWRTILTTHH